MKKSITNNIQNDCKNYLQKIQSGKMQQLYSEDQSQNGKITTRIDESFKLTFDFLSGLNFRQTLETEIYAEDFDTPYVVFPVGKYEIYYNPNITSFKASIQTDPISYLTDDLSVFSPKYSFLANIINGALVAIIKGGTIVSPEEEITSLLGSAQKLTNSADTEKQIRLVKGKISLQRRKLKKAQADEDFDRVKMLEDKIKAFRDKIISLREARQSAGAKPLGDDQMEFLKWAKFKFYDAGHTNFYKALTKIKVSDFINKDLTDYYQKQLKILTGRGEELGTQLYDDTFEYLYVLQTGYEKNPDITISDDVEIMLSCKEYYAIKNSDYTNKIRNKIFDETIETEPVEEEIVFKTVVEYNTIYDLVDDYGTAYDGGKFIRAKIKYEHKGGAEGLEDNFNGLILINQDGLVLSKTLNSQKSIAVDDVTILSMQILPFNNTDIQKYDADNDHLNDQELDKWRTKI